MIGRGRDHGHPVGVGVACPTSQGHCDPDLRIRRTEGEGGLWVSSFSGVSF